MESIVSSASMMNSTLFASHFVEQSITNNALKPITLIISSLSYKHSYLSSISLILLLTYTITQFLLRSLHHDDAKKSTKPNKKLPLPLPPRPSFLTILGNLSELYRKPQQTLAKLSNNLHAQDIMRLKLGPSTTLIIISSPNIAKEVMQTHDALFSDRAVPTIIKALDHHNLSLPFLPVSPLWRDLRRICNDQLFANKTLDASQGLRQRKLQELISDMNNFSKRGEAIDVGIAAFKACINFLSNTFVSQDFVESVENGEYKEIVSTILKLTGTANVVDIFPFLRILDPQGLERNTAHYVTKLFKNLDKLIEKRLKLREGGDYVTNNDLLDSLLDISQNDSKKMDIEKIKHFLLDLLVAGTDTTAYGLERAMTELLRNPEVMSKAKKELEETIGKGNPITESDVTKLPYLQAIVKEALRLYPPAPLLLPRKPKVDIQISGYTIPKGVRVQINAWAMGRNPNIWENAHLFTPERFLGSKIDVKGHDFELTPFGSGRRICPGAPLAMRMMHVMLGSLVNCFDWKLENNIKPQDMDLDQSLRAIPITRNN